ncbi:histone acetyltransferase type B catalytic subunit [Coccidioides immitis RS]|uniref:Histone acetyltransferase type B catalytic subunit n=2 Tax=Coccidioides immitis TaxID=5501 RepID=J3KFH4_COCIM|nr:histone acetyltransferase type B catalytic subunit [Coccidioides immitis RS]EAS34379.3 histone acetyltransferase type B catalytic subunit [Coccidioides immitis RS]KMP05520.1 histone acetyltransferase type B catalytic subunit [Coccidioides immitis RMSCC 2394]TPX21833.1 histone acetyltransferase 1 [Coccidioides immitis]
MEDQSAWTCSSNDAVQVSIVQPKGDGKLSTLSTFYPEFTYSIFGDSETIFGYMGLMIQLRFAAHDLRSNVCISYDEKFKTVKDISAVDLNKILKPFLPEESFTPLKKFEESLTKDKSAKDFKPPGEIVHTYTKGDRNYEVWAGCLADPDVQELLERIQIFASLFIEGGTPIEINDPEWTLERWMVYFVYEKLPEPPTPDASIYSFVGYGTTYKWYFYSPTSEKCKVSNGPFPYETVINLAELPSRLRISQFLILKPHQLSGHGTQLYQTIHRASLKDPTVYELTVEDPNEAFDSLRDTNDYHLLQPVFRHHNVTINANPYPATQSGRAQHRLVPTSRLIPVETLRDIRTKYKIAPTQFAHLVEMYLLSLIPMSHRGSHNVNLPRLRILKSRAPDEHDRRYYWWRMLVKQRLFKRHRDMLIQIDQAERVQKLEETLHNVEEGYENLLKAFGMKVTREPAESATPVTDEQQIQEEESGARAEHAVVRERTKRRFVVMEDEDEDDGDDQGVSSEGGGEKDNTNPPSKKARV